MSPLKHVALGVLVVVASMTLADALGDDPKRPKRPSDAVLIDAYPRLYDAAQRSRRAHAGRNVFEHGHPRDGRLRWSHLRREARRLWRELHPALQRARPLVPAWWLAASRAVAWCESRGDPTAVSAGGTYRGKWQFDLSTWASVGGSGDPAAAPEPEQDYRAYLLWRSRGWQPWPVCGH